MMRKLQIFGDSFIMKNAFFVEAAKKLLKRHDNKRLIFYFAVADYHQKSNAYYRIQIPAAISEKKGLFMPKLSEILILSSECKYMYAHCIQIALLNSLHFKM